MHRVSVLILACAIVAISTTVLGAEKLKAYNVNINETSVSGLSSGGYMAVQLHVAFSATISRVGVFAGGPYYCAQGQIGKATTDCMSAFTPPSVPAAISATDSYARSGAIDATTYLKGSRVYMFSGTADTTVKPAVMNALYTYYAHYMPEGNIEYLNTLNAAHTYPTDDSVNTNACTTAASPYISNCRLDGAGLTLEQLYDGLQPRNNGALTGSFIEFDQTEFASGASMATTAWAYVPKACASNAACKLHIALHGCLQNYATIGDKYVKNTGYNKWADTNNIIIIYPQTVASYVSPSNPNGCWDWFGYLSANYATKAGPQMKAIKMMIDRVSSGVVNVPAPTGLTVIKTTDNTISLTWKQIEGVTYNVYRNDAKANNSTVKSAEYVDTGLASGTTYSYYVTAVLASGAESQASTTVSGKTTGNPPPIQPPTDIHITDAASTSLTLKWRAANGAYNYNIYRNGARANSGPVQSTEFTDKALTPETTYSYKLTSVDALGMESTPSYAVTGKTTSAWKCTTYTASNYAQVAANRAYQSLGYVYANGSDDYMGLYNTFTTTTLAETAQGYFILGNCS